MRLGTYLVFTATHVAYNAVSVVHLFTGFSALGLCFIAGVWGGVTIYYREQKKSRALRSASKEADGQKNLSNPVEESNTVENFTHSRKGISFQSANSENQRFIHSASAPSEMVR